MFGDSIDTGAENPKQVCYADHLHLCGVLSSELTVFGEISLAPDLRPCTATLGAEFKWHYVEKLPE